MQLLPFSLLVREFIGGTPLDPPENCTPPFQKASYGPACLGLYPNVHHPFKNRGSATVTCMYTLLSLKMEIIQYNTIS